LKVQNQNFKILKISPGVVAAIHVAGVRGEPCGATHCIYVITIDMYFITLYYLL